MTRIAAVVIGRNEADRLPASLRSLLGVADPIVYVDSGSVDGSRELAAALGVDVVRLDTSTPFSVARGRNEGFRRIRALDFDVQFVQFVDADSEICATWIDAGRAALERDRRTAAAFGRIREQDPRRSVFARLYQAEFDAHFTQSDACPGMSMMRLDALTAAGGFVESLRGFEDTELSFRFRQAGWHITRVDADMAIHHARMATLREWWARKLRSGFAQGQERALHGHANAGRGIRESMSIWFWGLFWPAAVLVSAVPTHGWSLSLLGAYVLMVLRIRRRYLGANPSFANPSLYAASLMAGKFPEALGLAAFQLSRVRRRPDAQGRLA